MIDVHVKILGKSEDVKIAKELVLEKLDARVRLYEKKVILLPTIHVFINIIQGSRVTMKIDISYNDHSSIIGLKGNNIKTIMDETSTHIHFPDSNKDKEKDKEKKDFGRRANMQFNSHQNPFLYIDGLHNNINKSFPPKSNQVSLNGTLEGVERARAAVRVSLLRFGSKINFHFSKNFCLSSPGNS